MPTSGTYRTALVLSGGGSRGAYEAGVLNYIRTMLPPAMAERLRFHIICGSSVGAINSAFIAAMADEPIKQGQELINLWRALRTENIYRRGPVSLGKLLFRTVAGVLSHFLGVRGFAEPDDSALHFQGLFDTTPFFHHLRVNCPWPNISKNIQRGYVDAIAIAATNMITGQLEIFLQKNPELASQIRPIVRQGKISPRHVMASAALPILFPPVPIHNVYYNDGGMRLNTPLAPAVALGAARILMVGTKNPRRKSGEVDAYGQPSAVGQQPSLGDVLARFFHAILQDRLEADRAQVERINRLLEACAKHVTTEEYHAICQEVQVQRVDALEVAPSIPISTLVDETVRGSYKKIKSFGMLERFILRMLEVDPKRGNDLLSYFLFEPSYIEKLVDLGFEDARSKHDQLVEFAEEAISEKTVE